MAKYSAEKVNLIVKKLIAEQLGAPASEVTNDKILVDDLGADSLDVIELTMELEETFGLDIPDHEAEDLKTVQDVLDYIRSLVAG